VNDCARVGRDGDDISCVAFEHAEGRSEGEVSDNTARWIRQFRSQRREDGDSLESECVHPVEQLNCSPSLADTSRLLGAVAKRIPFREERTKSASDVRLELSHRLGGEGVRDDLALASVFGTVARVEQPAVDGDERVVELRLGPAGVTPSSATCTELTRAGEIRWTYDPLPWA
jgi:hypothetical protein